MHWNKVKINCANIQFIVVIIIHNKLIFIEEIVITVTKISVEEERSVFLNCNDLNRPLSKFCSSGPIAGNIIPFVQLMQCKVYKY